MKTKLTARQQLDNLTNVLVEDIMSLSEDELRAEIIEDGEDPDMVVSHVTSLIENTIRQSKK